jgi:hypothetical protein
MKQPDYIEGPKATKNFEEGMKALFKVPKERVERAEKKQAKKRATSRARKARKLGDSDED